MKIEVSDDGDSFAVYIDDNRRLVFNADSVEVERKIDEDETRSRWLGRWFPVEQIFEMLSRWDGKQGAQ